MVSDWIHSVSIVPASGERDTMSHVHGTALDSERVLRKETGDI